MSTASSIPDLVFYDIPSDPASTPRPWSPNTSKTLLLLRHLRVPFTIIYLPYPTITPFLHSHGLPLPASGYHTLPAITHPALPQPLTESLAIARFITKTYPQAKNMQIDETAEKVQMYVSTALATPKRLSPFVVPHTPKVLGKEQGEWFRKTREKRFGFSMEEYGANAKWEGVEEAFKEVVGMLGGGEQEVAYGDFVVGALLVWVRAVHGEGSELWKKIMEGDSAEGLGRVWEKCRPLLEEEKGVASDEIVTDPRKG